MSGRSRGLHTEILDYLEQVGPSSSHQLAKDLEENMKAVASSCNYLNRMGKIEISAEFAAISPADRYRKVTIWKLQGDERKPLALSSRKDGKLEKRIAERKTQTILDEQKEWLRNVREQQLLRKKMAALNSRYHSPPKEERR